MGSRIVNVDSAINLHDLRRMAKRRLPRIAFDFVEGGCDDELGIAHNERALHRFHLVPRYLDDISQRDQSVTLFGRTYGGPFGISPTGMAGLFRRNAELMFAQAAAAANVPYVMSIAATETLEELVKAARGTLWFQAYPTNDRNIVHDHLRRAREAGVEVLVVSVDVPAHSNRERNLRNGFGLPPKMPLPVLLEALRHPAWVLEYFLNGGPPQMKTNIPYVPNADAAKLARFFAQQSPCASQTWSDMETLRRLWPGAMLVKGIMHPDDAVKAIGIGADGIFVSNHGGRQSDRAPAPIEMLPLIRRAVGDKPTIIVDSGFRRGSDVVTALCLGAQAAFVGRPAVYAAAAGGLRGVQKALQILRHETDTAMAFLGCRHLAELGPHHLFDSVSLTLHQAKG